jgi:hypothetical protein
MIGPVLADQHDPVAFVEAEAAQVLRQQTDLPRRFGPAYRLPRAAALGAEEGLVAALVGALEEQFDEIVGRIEVGQMHVVWLLLPLCGCKRN